MFFLIFKVSLFGWKGTHITWPIELLGFDKLELEDDWKMCPFCLCLQLAEFLFTLVLWREITPFSWHVSSSHLSFIKVIIFGFDLEAFDLPSSQPTFWISPLLFKPLFCSFGAWPFFNFLLENDLHFGQS